MTSREQLLKLWKMKDAVPQDYITAALLVAARQGLHFHDFSRMPASLPEPTLKSDGGCTSQLQNFYDPQALTELSQGLVGTMVSSASLESSQNPGMLNFHAFREITKEAQANEVELNQKSVQAQNDKDEDSEDSGDDVVVREIARRSAYLNVHFHFGQGRDEGGEWWW